MLHPVYTIFHLVLWIAALYEIYTKKKLGGGFISICAIYLIFWATVKYDIGADYVTYLKIFNYMKYEGYSWHFLFNPTFKFDLEASYLMVCKAVAELGFEFYGVLFFYGFISIVLKSYMYYNYSPFPILSLMLYYMPLFFFEDQGQIRQGMAIGITFFSFKFVLERRLIAFLITVYIAYLFHKTSIIFIFAYWIAPLRITTLYAILIVFFSMLLSVLKIHTLVGPIVGDLGAKEAYDAFNQYGGYDEIGFSVLGELTKLLFLIVIFINDSNAIKKYPNYFYYRNLALLYYIFYYLFRGNLIFAIRLPGGFQPFIFITAAIIIYTSTKQFRIFFISFFFIYTILIHWRFTPGGISGGFQENTNIIFNDYNYDNLANEQ